MESDFEGSREEVKKPWTGGDSSETRQIRMKMDENTGTESDPVLETMVVESEEKTTGVRNLRGEPEREGNRKNRLSDQITVRPEGEEKTTEPNKELGGREVGGTEERGGGEESLVGREET